MIKNIFLRVFWGLVGIVLTFYGGILFLMGANVPSKAEIYYEPMGMASMVSVMIDNKNRIYTTSDAKSTVQVYDLDGSFLYGVTIPTYGSYDAVLNEDVIYIYTVRDHICYVIDNEKINEFETVENLKKGQKFRYMNQNELWEVRAKFYHKIELTNKENGMKETICLQNTPHTFAPMTGWYIALVGMLMSFPLIGWPIFEPLLREK